MPQLDGVEHQEVKVRGLRIHIAVAGPPDGRPVVLQHGWPQHWYEWQHLFAPLAQAGFRVIAPDFRGFGWSEYPPDEDFRKDTLADDLIELCRTLGYSRISFVGHDWGSWVGWLICLREPQLIERAVLLSVRAPMPPDRIEPAALLRLGRLAYQIPLAAPMPPGAKRVALKLVGSAIGRGGPGIDFSPYVPVLMQPSVLRATTLLYRDFMTRELPQLLAGRFRGERVTVPVRFLVGEGDFLYDDGMLDEQAANVDDFRGEALPGVGHFIPEEAPDVLRDRVVGFLTGPAVQEGISTVR
jgi:pimeloyl-ACP methyl ester carboxylesterase